MKIVILILFALLASLPAQPAPRRIDLSGVTEADIEATVLHQAALVRDAEEKVRAANVAAESAKADVEKLQGVIDTQQATIAKQAEQLHRWLIFGRTVLACIVAVAFAGAWRLTASLAAALWIRLAVCAGAGAAAAGLVFYVLTHLL